MSGNNIITASSISPRVLVSVRLGTTDTPLLSVGAGQSVKIAQATLCNTTASAVTVYLSIIQTGGTVGDGTHRVISGYSLAANDTLALADYVAGAMLGPGDMLASYAGTAAAVDLVVTGTLQA